MEFHRHWLYHPEQGAYLVETEADLNALEGDWYETPADFPPASLPGPDAPVAAQEDEPIEPTKADPLHMRSFEHAFEEPIRPDLAVSLPSLDKPYEDVTLADIENYAANRSTGQVEEQKPLSPSDSRSIDADQEAEDKGRE